MADKSLFGRLKKLFNTQVVVRRIGKVELKLLILRDYNLRVTLEVLILR